MLLEACQCCMCKHPRVVSLVWAEKERSTSTVPMREARSTTFIKPTAPAAPIDQALAAVYFVAMSSHRAPSCSTSAPEAPNIPCAVQHAQSSACEQSVVLTFPHMPTHLQRPCQARGGSSTQPGWSGERTSQGCLWVQTLSVWCTRVYCPLGRHMLRDMSCRLAWRWGLG